MQLTLLDVVFSVGGVVIASLSGAVWWLIRRDRSAIGRAITDARQEAHEADTAIQRRIERLEAEVHQLNRELPDKYARRDDVHVAIDRVLAAIEQLRADLKQKVDK